MQDRASHPEADSWQCGRNVVDGESVPAAVEVVVASAGGDVAADNSVS